MSDQVGGKSEALLLSVQDTVFNPSLRMLGTMFRLDSRIAGDLLGSAPREPTFKLVRGTRFSHDKSPRLPAFRTHTISGSSAPAMGLPLHGVLHKFPRSYAAGILFSRRVSNIIKKDISFLLPVGSNFESKEQSI